MWAPMIQQMRDELTTIGFKELKTSDDVKGTLPTAKGTTLVVVNSVCGCAGGIARPGIAMALKSGIQPDSLVTVFAGQDKEATASARALWPDFPPSSPSIVVMKDGKPVTMIHRHQIEGTSPQAVAMKLVEAVRSAQG